MCTAHGFFERALKVREALAASDPTRAQAQRDLSVSLDRLGVVEVQAGNLANPVPASQYFDPKIYLDVGTG